MTVALSSGTHCSGLSSSGLLSTRLARDASVRLFLQAFDTWLDDPAVTEIAVNEPGMVWIEQTSLWSQITCPEVTTELLNSLAVAVATFSHQKIDASTPLLSASLPDGSRIQFVLPPAVEAERTSFTLRKPSRHVQVLEDFDAAGFFDRVRPIQREVSEEERRLVDLLARRRYREFCRMAVKSRMNIVVCGATGSGKTTFMKSLVREIPDGDRLITIEDVRELFLPQANRVHLLYSKGGQSQSNVTPKALLEACLRMKPSRILLAELRGDECLYYIRNAASGHPGSITSCHAGSPAMAFEQMAIMIQDSPGGANLSFDVIMRLLKLTIDVVIQLQLQDGQRFISEIYFDPAGKLRAAG